MWKKVYVGPFTKEEATKLVDGIKEVANPDVNLIEDASIRKRPLTDHYDVFIKEVAGCGYCDGYGTVFEDVFDPDSGQMMRGVGKEVECICQLKK